MISRTLARPVEATVPPVPATLKKSGSLNSQASVVCATNTISSEPVLAPQARRHPEEKGLGQLPVTLGHAARDIQQEKHHRTHRRLTAARELPEAQILIDECRRIGLEGAPLGRFLERAAAIEP